MTTSRRRLIAAGLFMVCGTLHTGAWTGAGQFELRQGNPAFARSSELELRQGRPSFARSTGFELRQGKQEADPPARPDLVRQPYSDGDITFMAGMIPHHAQAVVIAGWAASHGARPELRILCERQVIAQTDEITFMRNWLRDRGEPVPARDATHHRMKMNGVEHDMLMPGMLSPEQLAELDKARGPDWDRLFLTFMIRHHEGALKMVDQLFASYGALQDDDVYKLASEIHADQEIEIERMQKMLAAMDKRNPQ